MFALTVIDSKKSQLEIDKLELKIARLPDSSGSIVKRMLEEIDQVNRTRTDRYQLLRARGGFLLGLVILSALLSFIEGRSLGEAPLKVIHPLISEKILLSRVQDVRDRLKIWDKIPRDVHSSEVKELLGQMNEFVRTAWSDERLRNKINMHLSTGSSIVANAGDRLLTEQERTRLERELSAMSEVIQQLLGSQ